MDSTVYGRYETVFHKDCGNSPLWRDEHPQSVCITIQNPTASFSFNPIILTTKTFFLQWLMKKHECLLI